MTSRHLVDPELLAQLDEMPGIALSAEILPMMRASLMQMLASAPPLGAGTTMTEHRVPAREHAPEVRVLVYRPDQADNPLPAYLHIHGGGYVIGQPEMNDARNRRYARDLGCIVVSVDYRLAPETPHPGPVEDCYAALRWLHAEAAVLGVDPARIAIGGESAGGGLAAALALVARDRSQVPVAFQLLIYPMLDDRTCDAERGGVHTGEFVWTRESNALGWRALLGCEPGGEDVPAHAVPARALDLSRLPPAFVAVGALDLFAEEDIEYARRLMRAGVPTELHVYPGAYHGFDLTTDARVAKAFERDCAAALARGLGIS